MWSRVGAGVQSADAKLERIFPRLHRPGKAPSLQVRDGTVSVDQSHGDADDPGLLSQREPRAAMS